MQDRKRDTDIKNRLLDSEKARVGWSERIALKHICEIDRQSKFDAWDRVLRAGALGWPWGMGRGGRWKGGQDGERKYSHGGFMSMCGKNHHNIVN